MAIAKLTKNIVLIFVRHKHFIQLPEIFNFDVTAGFLDPLDGHTLFNNQLADIRIVCGRVKGSKDLHTKP